MNTLTLSAGSVFVSMPPSSGSVIEFGQYRLTIRRQSAFTPISLIVNAHTPFRAMSCKAVVTAFVNPPQVQEVARSNPKFIEGKWCSQPLAGLQTEILPAFKATAAGSNIFIEGLGVGNRLNPGVWIAGRLE
jgi:hypothetical protein